MEGNRILGTVGGIEIREQGLVAPVYKSLKMGYDLLTGGIDRYKGNPGDIDPYNQRDLA